MAADTVALGLVQLPQLPVFGWSEVHGVDSIVYSFQCIPLDKNSDSDLCDVPSVLLEETEENKPAERLLQIPPGYKPRTI